MKIFSLIIIVLTQLTLTSCAKESTFMGAGAQNPASQDSKLEPEDNQNPSNKGIGIPDGVDSQSGTLTFQASRVVDAAYTMVLNTLSSKTDFTLENLYSDRTDMHKQKSRNLVSQLATQGTMGKANQDLFDQKADRGAVDILLVVDNSRSMAEEHKNLSTKLSSLLSKLEDTRWNIGITSTDVADGCDIDVISYTQSDAVEIFKNQINKLGTTGNGNEQGIYRAVNGLKCNDGNWLRKDAVLAILIVSDEDNCSRDGSGCKGKAWDSIDYLTNYVESNLGRSVGKNTGFYGIFWHPDQSCQTGENRGHQYKALMNYKADAYNVPADSRWGSICANDYTPTLESISLGISYQLDNSWELTAPPEPGSVSVSVILKDGSTEMVDTSAYSIEGKIITFHPDMTPPLGSKIKVEYLSGRTPKFNSVELLKKPALDTTRVWVNDVELKATEFTVMDQTLVFTDEPADNAKVKITYKEDTPLLLNFPLEGQPKAPSEIVVKVNDQKVENFAYVELDKLVVFQTPPEDSANIAISYVNIDGPKLSYDIATSGENPRNFKLYYGEKLVDFVVDKEDMITIDANDHDTGRMLTLVYEVDNDNPHKIELPHIPISNSVAIESDSDICKAVDYEIQGSTIVSQCVITEQVELMVKYSHIEARLSYAIPSDLSLSNFPFEVFIDGKKASAFKLEENMLTFSKAPAIGATVEIRYGTIR